MRASYLEIYNEDVRDLLGADTKQRLEVGADPMWGGQEGWGSEKELGSDSCGTQGPADSASLVLGAGLLNLSVLTLHTAWGGDCVCCYQRLHLSLGKATSVETGGVS